MLSLGRMKRTSVPDMAAICARVKALRAQGLGISEACDAVALEFGKVPATVYSMVKRFEPTTELAETYLKSQAFRLATRVVREANVEQAIDILARKNMGVLAPKTEEGAGQGGFFLSVSADTCGAVKVVAGQAGAQRLGGSEGEARVSLLGASTEQEVIDVQEVKPSPQKLAKKGFGVRPIDDRQQKAIDSAKVRLKKAQRVQRRLDKFKKHFDSASGSPQNADGDAQE